MRIVTIALFVMAAALSTVGQTLPSPSGSMKVGTATFGLADSSRKDPFSKTSRFRDIVLQAWYPVDDSATTKKAPYVISGGLVKEMVTQNYNLQTADTIMAIGKLETDALLDAPIKRGRDRFPVLLLSHGLGEPRFNYTSLAQDLASHGYIVLTIDHPYGGLTMLADGSILSTASDNRGATEEGSAQLVTEWAADAKFIVDYLAKDARSLASIAGRANLNEIGMLGHSLGGAAALEACRVDKRFKACADLDGQPFGAVRDEGVKKPTLVFRNSPIYSDADLAKRGRTRAQWEEMGRAGQKVWSSIEPRDHNIPMFTIKIAGTGHMSFSDLAFTMPDTITRFGGRVIDASRAYGIISSYVVAFFDQYLKDHRSDLLNAPASPYPEVSLVKINN